MSGGGHRWDTATTPALRQWEKQQRLWWKQHELTQAPPAAACHYCHRDWPDPTSWAIPAWTGPGSPQGEVRFHRYCHPRRVAR